MKKRSFLLVPYFALFALFQGGYLNAQPYRDDCPDCWRNYTFDPDDYTFVFGAHGWELPDFYHDSLRLDFGQQYSAHNTLQLGPDDFEGELRYLEYRHFVDTVVARANALGYGLVFSPGRLRWLIESAKAPEYYLDADQTVVHTLNFLDRWGEQDTALKSRYFFWGRKMPALDPPRDTLMAERIRNATRGFQLGQRDIADALQEEYDDSTGTEKLEELYEVLAASTSNVNYLDSLHHWRLVYTLKVDSLDISEVPDNGVIAYAVLYRRLTPAQDVCRCAFYEQYYVDTITRKDYEDRANIEGPNPNLGLEGTTPSGIPVPYFDIPGDFVDYIVHDTLLQPALLRDTACIVAKPGGGYDTLVTPHAQITSWNPPLAEYPAVTMTGPNFLRQSEWFGWPDCIGRPCLGAGYCDSLLQLLKDSGVVSASAFNRGEVSEASDIEVQFYSTGRVPVTFVRARLETHFYSVLADGRLDFLIERELDTLTHARNADLNSAMMRIGEADEPDWSVYRAQAYLSAHIQDYLYTVDSTDTRGVYANVNSNFDGCRVFTGDMDSTRVKLVQVFPVQPYPIRTEPMPIRYANPEKMSPEANTI